MSNDAWLRRCLTCKYGIPGKSLMDTQCCAKSCSYTERSLPLSPVELAKRDIYTCRSCHKAFDKAKMYPKPFWILGAYAYCKSCMENYKLSYYEAKSFRDSFSSISLGGRAANE